MNRVVLIGNLVKAPDLTQTNSGISVCKFTIAVKRAYAAQGQEPETDFFNIVAWRGIAENCGKFLSKGSKVAVVGRVEIRNYDAQDGTKRYVTEIIADEVEFLNRVNGGESGNSNSEPKQTQAPKKTSELKPVIDEELPF